MCIRDRLSYVRSYFPNSKVSQRSARLPIVSFEACAAHRLRAVSYTHLDVYKRQSLFLLFVSLGIPQGYTTVVLAHITFCTPYVVLRVLPRLKQMNPNIYEAALDLRCV